MQIRKIMSTPPVTCREGDTLNRPAQLMWEHDCGVIPVTDGDGKLVGMITDRDICMAAYTQGRALPEIPVVDAMTTQVYSCRPDESIEAAEGLMRDNQIRRVPIVDDTRRLVGLVSLHDLARYTASVGETNGLNRDFVQTVAAICRPRSWMLGASSIQEAAEFRATPPAPPKPKPAQPRRRRVKST
jgi:CBS domain-containing protein